jgi:flagellin
MALNVISNFAANIAHRNLKNSDSAATSSLNKLSSGSRVVSAKDDAASQAIGSALKAEVMAMEQATVNAKQAGSLLQIADGAMANVTDILVRAKMLAVQASSGQVSRNERTMFDNEYQSLLAELDRIAITTKFAGNLLVNGTVEVTKGVNGVSYEDNVSYLNFVDETRGFADFTFEEDVSSAVFRISYNQVTRGLTVMNQDSGVSQTVVLANRSIVPGKPEVVKFSQLGATVTLNELFNKNTAGFPNAIGSVVLNVYDKAAAQLDASQSIASSTPTAAAAGVAQVDEVVVSGAIQAGDIFNLTVGSTSYRHVASSNDDAGTIRDALVTLVNADAGSVVTAAATSASGTLTLTADTQNVAFVASVASTDRGVETVHDLEVTGGGSSVNLIKAGPAFGRLPQKLAMRTDGDLKAFYIFADTAATTAVAARAMNNPDVLANVIATDTSDAFNAISDVRAVEPELRTPPIILGTLQRDGQVYTAELRDLTISSEADKNLVCTIRFESLEAADTSQSLNYGVIDLGTLPQLVGANSVTRKDTKTFNFKLGTAARDTDVLSFEVDSITTRSLLLNGTNISSEAQAKAASAAISDAIVKLSQTRAAVGASQNRLEFASTNLATSIENTEAARSDLLDLDVAREMTNFTSKQILLQAGIAMLAQANEMPNNLLRLFQR